jgi:phosphoadenosine phosphosulfate reductase
MAELAELRRDLENAPGFDIAALNGRFAESGTRALLGSILEDYAGKRMALVSSFGANSVVLLHLVAGIDPDLPVLFIDTGKLFADTHRYRAQLTERLGLTDVRIVAPRVSALGRNDPHGALWMRDKDACCDLRKVASFAEAIADFDIWISGRKRYQGGRRSDLALFEEDGARLKINPLANWTAGDVDIYRSAFDLPQHPLVAKGFRSIGCEPCTTTVREGEDERAGRWRGYDKSECGIHVDDNMGGLP